MSRLFHPKFLRYFRILLLFLIAFIFCSSIAHSETIIYSQVHKCEESKKTFQSSYEIPEEFRPKDPILQGEFGTCYGCSALYLLQSHYNQTKPTEDTEATRFALLDVLGQGCCGELKEGGLSSHVLYQIKKSLSLAIEPYPVDYRQVFQKLKGISPDQGISCQRGTAPLVSPQLMEMNQILESNTSGQNTLFEAIDRHPDIRRKKLPPFDLHDFTPTDLNQTKLHIQKLLASHPAVPVQWSYCLKSTNDECVMHHSVVITGTRTVCCDGKCLDEFQIADSNGEKMSGWFLADPLVTSAIQFNGGYSFLTPCSNESNSTLQKCNESVISEYPIHFLAKANDAEMIRKMIQKGEDPNKMDARGLRPLSIATGLGRDQVVHALLDSGAYVGLPNRDGSSPLVGAITFGNANLVTHLLNQGASPEIGNSVISPLGLASRLGKNDILRLLLNKGADPNAVYYHGTSPLFSATASNNTSGMIELLKKGANINHRNAQGRTALIIAVSTNQLEATSVLLDHGIEVNIQEAALLIRFTGTLKNPEKQKFIKVLKKFTLNLLNQGAGVPQENLKAAKLLASKLKNL